MKKYTQYFKYLKSPKPFFVDAIISVLVLLITSLCCVLLHNVTGVGEALSDVLIFGIFLVSILTDGYFFGLVAAIYGVAILNFAFLYPFLSFDFSSWHNFVISTVMVVIAVLTSACTSKYKIRDAEQRAREIEQISANSLRAVSHDIRTPLTSISSASQMLLNSHENLTDEQRSEILNTITNESNWLIHLVENILSVSRINGNHGNLHKEIVVLDELIDATIIKFNTYYPSQTVTLFLPDELITIPMDSTLISQVIFNLLENAAIHAKGLKTLSLLVHIEGKKAVFEIVDDGCGIRKNQFDSIFTYPGFPNSDSYHSSNATYDIRKQNSGLGLSLCKAIIELHGGKISVFNNAVSGCTFKFTLDTTDNKTASFH